MATITAKMVGDLRAKTGAGMMDCKKALTEAGGDMEQAIDLLRKKGLSAAAKKSGRVAAEGMIAAAGEGKCGALVEVNSETDFVAKNEAFQVFAQGVVDKVRSGQWAARQAIRRGIVNITVTRNLIDPQHVQNRAGRFGSNYRVRLRPRFCYYRHIRPCAAGCTVYKHRYEAYR